MRKIKKSEDKKTSSIISNYKKEKTDKKLRKMKSVKELLKK